MLPPIAWKRITLISRVTYHFQRRNIEDYRKAVIYFDEATRLDPEYALAYAERSEAWS